MEYKRFFLFNVVGALVWVLLFVVAGYWFGNIPAVKESFSLLIMGIIVLSVAPPLVGLIRNGKLQRAKFNF